MPDEKPGWLVRRVEDALRRSFTRAYETVRVDPEKFLLQMRTAYGVSVRTYDGVFTTPVEQLDAVADDVIRGSMKIAAAEGAGFGLFGLITIVPDLSVLAAITMRTIQKLSLVYGFQFNTDDEIGDLWLAAASAAGVDLSRELIEKEIINKMVPRIIRRIAVQAGAEVSEKIAGRIIPLVSSALGGGLNYYFVRAWAQRAQRHFREKHLALREQVLLEAAKGVDLPGESENLYSQLDDQGANS